jgi:methionine-rich copper-binding protein CopC
MIMRTRPAIIALCALTLPGLWPWAAWSHVFPQRAEPRVGETVTVAPIRVRIWFDGSLEPAFSMLRVLSASGQQVDKGMGVWIRPMPRSSK